MIRPPLATSVTTLLIGSMLITPGVLLAIDRPLFGPARSETGGFRSPGVESAAEREITRRYFYTERGLAEIVAGDKSMKDRDYASAVAHYQGAADMIPNSDNTAKDHRSAVKRLCEASCKLAEQRITEGRYKDAENTLRNVLDNYDPKCKDAVVILSRLEMPDYYNKTITPRFRGNVEQVKQWFIDADGFYNTGRYDLAFKRCDQILNLDPYNIAARQMQEKINKGMDDGAIAGYNEARSRAIKNLDKAWSNPVRKFNVVDTVVIDQGDQKAGLTARTQKKLEKIIIPRLEFREATIREAVDFLKKKSVELDDSPTEKGVNIVLKLEGGSAGPAPDLAPSPVAPAIPGLEPLPGAAAAPLAPAGLGVSPTDARITVSLNNIPLIEALKYVTSLANLKFKVEPFAVSIVPQSVNIDTLVTKEWKVRPDFINRVPGGGGTADGLAAPAGGAPSDATKGGSGIAAQQAAKDFLIAQGVQFGPQASAIYIANSSKLIVRNTQEQLDLIETIIDSSSGPGGPVQIEIESKFVEISQNNLKELSFDWLLGAFNLPNSSSSLFGSGGTSGTSPRSNSVDFPFVAPGGTAVGGNPVTGGNRSGGVAISANAVDALLFGVPGASSLAPAAFALSGVFTDPQFQLVIRALNQKKGVDLLSAPRVTTKSGQRAVIEIIREFRYPTEFDPPQIPQNFGNQGNNGGGGGGLGVTIVSAPSSFPVTPTTPTSFETRNTGVTLEVEPVIGPDGYTIDLNLVPQVVEFEGFINYGSPIQTTATNPITGISSTNVITENTINQPIFSTRKVTTSVSVFDGATVVLGGLMREDVQKVEDKVPFLGDIPLIGRLFRSNVDQHLKRNLVIFVSARLINPAGDPVRSDEEKEEIVETLPAQEIISVLPELPLMSK